MNYHHHYYIRHVPNEDVCVAAVAIRIWCCNIVDL